jgi:hypothetical protein
MLLQKPHKDENYVVNGKLFFPKNNNTFKKFLDIIFNKELEIDFIAKHNTNNKTHQKNETD